MRSLIAAAQRERVTTTMRAELLELNPLLSERMRKQVESEVLNFINSLVVEIEKDNVLPNASKLWIGEIAQNLCKRIELERSLIDS
ncbi:MAG TPA: hypothetical protein V6D26_30810 [Stenomitos sp.]